MLNSEILFEYLVDGSERSIDADLFFDSASESEIFFLNNIVLHEVIKSFEENVKFDKCDVLKALQALITNSQIRFEDRQSVIQANETYRSGRSNFSECLKDEINKRFFWQEKNIDEMNTVRQEIPV